MLYPIAEVLMEVAGHPITVEAAVSETLLLGTDTPELVVSKVKIRKTKKSIRAERQRREQVVREVDIEEELEDVCKWWNN